MHILFLTDNFPPEVNAPASRTYEHCREWVRQGHQVTVITCAPNFPNGRIYEGYRNALWSRSSMEGIDVIRVWTFMSANSGFLLRTIDYASFMLAALPAAVMVKGVDVVVGTSPQLFTPCAGLAAAALRRLPFVFELRDLWPASMRAVGAVRNQRLLGWLEALELFLYRRSTHIVSVTNAFRDDLVERGVPVDKISVTMNGADLARFTPRPKDADLVRQLGLEGCRVVGYVGTLGMAHALGTLLDAAQILERDPRNRDVRVLLLGDGAQKDALKAETRRRGIGNLVFIDSVPREEVVRYWSLLDIAVIHLRKDPLFRTVVPSKLFECMAMGIPVVHGVEGESAGIVAREGCGLVFEPENARALADRILELLTNPSLLAELSARALAAAPRHSRIAHARQMLDTLERQCQRRGEAALDRTTRPV